MGSHDSFGHLKHKLWPKEGSRVKLTVWLPTTKNQESIQFPCVQVGWDILLESAWRMLQLCFRPHLNRRFAHKVMGPQSSGSPNFGNFKTPIWESRDKMPFGCGPRVATKYTIRRKVVVSPKSRLWWVLWIQVCPWFILAPKVFQLCTNHLVLVLCRSMWVVNACHSS
jgi:hypothetical protein